MCVSPLLRVWLSGRKDGRGPWYVISGINDVRVIGVRGLALGLLADACGRLAHGGRRGVRVSSTVAVRWPDGLPKCGEAGCKQLSDFGPLTINGLRGRFQGVAMWVAAGLPTPYIAF